MKTTALIVFFSILSKAYSAPPLNEIRNSYALSVSDKQVCRDMLSSLQKQEQHHISLAYLGALQVIWANHTFNPFEKFSTFKKGKKHIEQAVAESPDDAEIRFIRLSIQYNVPRFLGYRSHILADKNFLLANYKHITSNELKNLILDFFKTTDLLTATEYNQLWQTTTFHNTLFHTIKTAI